MRSPARDFDVLRRDLSRFFDDFLPATRADEGAETPAMWVPRADLAETEDAFVLSLDLPGIPKENVDITLEEDTLKISGERAVNQEHKGDRFTRIERSYGRFFRAFRFNTPVNPDGIEASYNDGVLTVRVAKAEQSRPRRIEIR
ncbi:MAG TPA: Hsp20/alpha crystallin family protein [Rubricoccaceae bacterium]|nr:Hsp20/alpha crystallin family protein [Rubricoccaceae bacterium]